MEQHWQAKFLACGNRLQKLQNKVTYYEEKHDYKNGINAYVEYIEYIRGLNQPVTLITLYFRFARFCLQYDDLEFAADLKKEIHVLMQNYSDRVEGINIIPLQQVTSSFS